MPLSPAMQQYLQIKEKYKDCILFFRMGDFYEMFFEDAITASKELDITLTGKDCGLEERAPMCGVPYHAAENYISKLIASGYKVAICEQTSEPGKTKIVDREVVRVVTAGTVYEDNMLEETKNNFLASIYCKGGKMGVAYCDITTGETYVTQFVGENLLESLCETLARILPAEIIACPEADEFASKLSTVLLNYIPKFSKYEVESFDRAVSIASEQFGKNFLNDFSLKDKNEAVVAVSMLTEYLKETQKKAFSHINKIQIIENKNYLNLDVNTRRNLEISETMLGRKKRGSLLWLLDRTETSMGARLLRKWVDEPLTNEKEIEKRQQGVNDLFLSNVKREAVIENLSKINDIQRLCSKISMNKLNPKDCLSLAYSLSNIPKLKECLSGFRSTVISELHDSIISYKPIEDAIMNAIREDAGMILKDGDFIKDGYSPELDKLKSYSKKSREILSLIEQKERERTNIKNLKISYNKVFGYFIEVNKSQADLVPFDYIRKQTVANNERYITEELKILEEKILTSQEDSLKLELSLFEDLRKFLNENVVFLQELALTVAKIDCLVSLATIAVRNNYVMPKVSSKISKIEITEGRHPVIEEINKSEVFISNDTFLNSESDRTIIITGPNMAGKSTYMRQVALIVLMAHIGSFVPAKKAEISLTDRIFTRVGASDDLAQGQSTFMVELSETNVLLSQATDRSLLIIDELGRGTSTYDGLSIAYACIKYISEKLKCKTLFATHYHELTELEGKLEGVKNYSVSVKEYGGSIIFLHKIIRGAIGKSYGIEVAKLAGLPKEVISDAKEFLYKLENDTVSINKPQATKESKPMPEHEVLEILKQTDINNLSPMNAFELLMKLKEKV